MTEKFDAAECYAQGQRHHADTMALASYTRAGGTPDAAALHAALRNEVRDLAALRRRVNALVDEVRVVNPAHPGHRTALALELAALDELESIEALVAVELLAPAHETFMELLREAL